MLGGRAKRSTYFCQAKGNDERNGKKPQGKLSDLHLFNIQLTKSCMHRTTQPRINLLALTVARTLAQAIHVPVGNLRGIYEIIHICTAIVDESEER